MEAVSSVAVLLAGLGSGVGEPTWATLWMLPRWDASMATEI